MTLHDIARAMEAIDDDAHAPEVRRVVAGTIGAFCRGRADAAYAPALVEALRHEARLRALMGDILAECGPRVDRLELATSTMNVLLRLEAEIAINGSDGSPSAGLH